jgi:transcriptional regulator with XRE-family HTH domain
MRLSQMLRKLREARGLSQAQLSRAAKVPQSYISELEAGEKKKPSVEVLGRLATKLGVPLRSLMEGAMPEVRTEVQTKSVKVVLKSGEELYYEEVAHINSQPHRLELRDVWGDALAEFDKNDIKSWYSE